MAAEPTGYTTNPSAGAYPPQQGYAQDPATQAAYPPQGNPPQDPAAQAAYPPQDPAYPQQQPQDYPPQQQQGYPPQQQQGYPPQQQAYPPQQGYPPGYDNKQPYPPQGYPPQGYPQQGAPPPYVPGQQTYAGQQTETQVVVVQQQPQVVVQPVRRYGTGDHGLIYAIVASVCIFFCGAWCSLFCTIPAIFVSISAQDAERRGDDATMHNQARTSIILTSTGIFFSIVAWVVYIVLIATPI